MDSFNKAGVLAAAALAAAMPTQADAFPLSGNIKYLASTKDISNSYPEINASYTLPGNVNGFTFVDYCPSSTLFGKTTLDKTIKNDLMLTSQTVHANEPATNSGIGLKLNIPVKNGYASVAFLPLWIDSNARGMRNKNLITLVGGKSLGNGWNVEAFADIDVNDSHTCWSYGEIELSKEVAKNYKIGFNVALNPSGKSMPKVEGRVMFRYDFDLSNFGGKN